MGNSGNHAAEQPAVVYDGCLALCLDVRVADWGAGAYRAKPQRVDGTHRPRAHRENIPDDAAHTGRRPLKRFDRARVIVRLNLEGDGDAVANIDDAGVFFSGSDEDLRRFGRKCLKQRPAVLVGAVLAPHDRENAKLSVAGIAPKDSLELLKFIRGQVMLLD